MLFKYYVSVIILACVIPMVTKELRHKHIKQPIQYPNCSVLWSQLEDCEFAKTAALKARQSADVDLNEMQGSLDDAQRSRKETEDRASRLLKEKTELQTQVSVEHVE